MLDLYQNRPDITYTVIYEPFLKKKIKEEDIHLAKVMII